MFSKTERKILMDLVDLIREKKIETAKRKNLSSKERKKSTEKIKALEYKLDNYFSQFSDNYQRVLKHRIEKKTRRMVDDLILVHWTCKYLKIRHFVSLLSMLDEDLKQYFPKYKRKTLVF